MCPVQPTPLILSTTLRCAPSGLRCEEIDVPASSSSSSQAPSAFRVTYVAAKQHAPSRRTDVDMKRQEMIIAKTRKQRSDTLRGQLLAEQYCPRQHHEAFLIALVHEARRYRGRAVSTAVVRDLTSSIAKRMSSAAIDPYEGCLVQLSQLRLFDATPLGIELPSHTKPTA